MNGPMTVSTSTVIRSDHSAFTLCLLSFLFLVTVLAIPFLIVTIPMLIRRVRLVRETLQDGITVQGRVEKVKFHRAYYSVRFFYQFQGETFRSENRIPWFRKQLEEHSTIEVTHLIENPSRGFILDYYTDPGTELRRTGE